MVEIAPFLLGLFAVALIILSFSLRIMVRRHTLLTAELHSAQRELSQTQERMQKIRDSMAVVADAAFDALLLIDADKRVIIINQSARELFHVKEQAVGQTLMTVTRNHELDAIVQSAMRGESELETQLDIFDRSLRIRTRVLHLSQQTTVILVLQDITELLRLTRARREMVANFSHDLRTPISSIRLLVDTLMTSYGRNAERDVKSISKIGSEIDSLQHMMQELIDLSMIESGKAIIRMVPVTFNDVVRDAIKIMETQLDQKKLEVKNAIPEDIEVLIDPEQTRRVIMNVMHNAIKFTPSNGQIIFTSDRSEQFAIIRIRDTGRGIPPQDRTRIFERFYQVDSSRTGHSGVGGSGLGLSIAKHIIEAQGGKIWAEAGMPNGAVIAFTLPLADTKCPKSVTTA